MTKLINVALWLLVIPVLSVAQINNVSYRLSFNPQTNLYDCYLQVNEGLAIHAKDRVQLNAQLTILVPTGSKIEIVQNHMPLQNNQDFSGSLPMEWNKSNVVRKPASDPFYDYVSIVPQLSPASFYNELTTGDQVKLFTCKISHVDNCGDDIRLYDNQKGLPSTAIGMKGGDFSNGFTVGGIKQKYSGNATRVTPAIEVIDNIKSNTKNGIYLETSINENAKFGPYVYEWFTPAGDVVEGNSLKILQPKQSDYGVYQLMVTDARGCKQLKNVELKNSVSDQTHQLDNGENPKDVSIFTNTRGNYNSLQDAVNIYPNPASNEFFINVETEVGTKVDIILTDLNGRSILKNIASTIAYQPNLNVQVDASDLTAGAYMVITRMNGKEDAQKVIIVK